MARHRTLMLALLFLIAGRAAADVAEIATIECVPAKKYFAVKYISQNDDFFSEPNLPARCRLGSVAYKIKGKRGNFSETGRCGAQPPVSIEVTRNGVRLLDDVVFGGNCFGGPAIAEFEIKEANGNHGSLRLCVFEQPGAEPECSSLPISTQGKSEMMPITQANLKSYSPRHDR